MPTLAQSTVLQLIELYVNPVSGQVSNVIAQYLQTFTSDGAVIAQNNTRAAYTAADPAATALLGATVAGNLAQIATQNNTIVDLQEQLAAVQGQLNSAQAALSSLTQAGAPA